MVKYGGGVGPIFAIYPVPFVLFRGNHEKDFWCPFKEPLPPKSQAELDAEEYIKLTDNCGLYRSDLIERLWNRALAYARGQCPTG